MQLSHYTGREHLNTVDGHDRNLHSNIHNLPQEGNFHYEQRNTITLDTVVDYKHHMGYVDKKEREWENGHQLLNQNQTWQMDEAAVFPSLRVGHSEHLLSSFLTWWEENFIQIFNTHYKEHFHGDWTRTVATPVGKPPTPSANINSFNKHWPDPSRPEGCHVCSVRGVTWKVCVKRHVMWPYVSIKHALQIMETQL